MDHSLRGYLERRSTEELETILNYVVNNYVHRTEDAVREIIAILEEREKDIKQEITPEQRALWGRYLEKAKQKLKKQDEKTPVDDRGPGKGRTSSGRKAVSGRGNQSVFGIRFIKDTREYRGTP